MTIAEQARPGVLVEIDRIRSLLCAHLTEGEPGAGRSSAGGPIDAIASRLGLSDFERDVLMLAAAVELDGEVAALVGQAQGTGDPRPTFALAMAALPGAHWDALTPERPLRRWSLVELGGTGPLATRSLRIDEQLLHLVAGLVDPTGTLDGLALGPLPPSPLTSSQLGLAEELARSALAVPGRVVLRLDGDDHDAKLEVARCVAALLGLTLLRVRDAALAEVDLVRAAMILDREARLGDRLVLTSNERLLELLDVAVVATAAEDLAGDGRTVLARRIDHPRGREQVELWTDATAPFLPGSDGLEAAVAEVAHHYRLGARSIQAIVGAWSVLRDAGAADLRRLTRERARVSLGSLAELIEPGVGWDDLVLPAGQIALLHELAEQVRYRSQVYDEWGFGQQSSRGLGVSALFAGESGTGKTMAAEVIAAELGLDLFRIDLSAVVSKYIGETEKNLRTLFDAAESGGAVLLFDEADALFGKRSEVKDSHDRYANLEVAYLLQRMESYRGLAILTTNLRANVDRAFLRRLRFVVQFPFPDTAQRAELWRRIFPERTPVDGLDPDQLAQLQISGGSIRSIAVSAAFAAAAAGSPVRPEHVLRAAEVEYAKAERTLTDTEVSKLRGPR